MTVFTVCMETFIFKFEGQFTNTELNNYLLLYSLIITIACDLKIIIFIHQYSGLKFKLSFLNVVNDFSIFL